MATGYKVLCQDGSGYFQIDQTYRNLFQRQKGSVTTNAWAAETYGVSSIQVTISGCLGMPIVAVRSAVLANPGILNQVNATTWNCTMYAVGPIGTAIDWYAFDSLGPGDESSYGFKVKLNDGTVIFDALRKPMRVVDMKITPGNTGASGSYAAGRVYAVAIAGGVYVASFGGGGGTGYVVNLHGASVDNASVSISPFQILGVSGSSFTQVRNSFALICDVTNY